MMLGGGGVYVSEIRSVEQEQKQYYGLKVRDLHFTPSSDTVFLCDCEEKKLTSLGFQLLDTLSLLALQGPQQRFSLIAQHMAQLMISIRVFALECNKNN